MSEVGRQLVKNEKGRKQCLADAGESYRTLVPVLAAAMSEEGLARLDVERARGLLDELESCKTRMQALRQERAELVSQAGA